MRNLINRPPIADRSHRARCDRLLPGATDRTQASSPAGSIDSLTGVVAARSDLPGGFRNLRSWKIQRTSEAKKSMPRMISVQRKSEFSPGFAAGRPAASRSGPPAPALLWRCLRPGTS